MRIKIKITNVVNTKWVDALERMKDLEVRWEQSDAIVTCDVELLSKCYPSDRAEQRIWDRLRWAVGTQFPADYVAVMQGDTERLGEIE